MNLKKIHKFLRVVKYPCTSSKDIKFGY